MNQQPTYEDVQRYVVQLENRIRELEMQISDNQNQAEKLKNRFLANISHEIRTPMNAILGFSSLLNDNQLTGSKREEYMDHINQSSTRLIQLIEALIDVSLIETGQLTINYETCFINQLLKEIYQHFNFDRHKSDRNSIALLLNSPVKDENFTIYSDRYRLHQVITNLLKNAFKFTEKGIIEFGYFPNYEEDKIVFYVTDSGKGIFKDKTKLIFESFEKDTDIKRLYNGIGLGLTLSKGIIQLMGGKIWVEENVFKGSTFKFAVPYKKLREMESTQNPFTSKLFIA